MQRIYPIILAAGSSQPLGFPKALARFGRRTALEIAVTNCRELGGPQPLVVLGDQAARVAQEAPPGVRLVIHRYWRRGQLSSLRAGLVHVPRFAPFLLYPVDLPLLKPSHLRRLVRQYNLRLPGQSLVMPRFGERLGHPVIFAPEIRSELERAETAREVVYRDLGRVRFLAVRTSAVLKDFQTPGQYRQLVRY